MKHALAIACLGLALAAGPALADSIDSLLVRSRTAETRGDMDAAIRLAQSAIVGDPTRVTSYVALADLYAHEDQPEFAGYYYAEALGLDPTDPTALKGMALADKDAARNAKAATAKAPDCTDPTKACVAVTPLTNDDLAAHSEVPAHP